MSCEVLVALCGAHLLLLGLQIESDYVIVYCTYNMNKLILSLNCK